MRAIALAVVLLFSFAAHASVWIKVENGKVTDVQGGPTSDYIEVDESDARLQAHLAPDHTAAATRRLDNPDDKLLRAIIKELAGQAGITPAAMVEKLRGAL